MSDSVVAEDNENKKKIKKTSIMFMYIRELLFLLALAITSYATLFNSMPKVGKPPTAMPFFPSSSLVQDYYRGTMGGAFDQANQADIAVVMFYAPWDTESQAARPVFDAAAKFFHQEIYFAAVSCWAPSSECRQHYPKIRRFPVIVVYPQGGSGIQYHGPIVADYLIRFLRTMLRPIQRIHNYDDITALFPYHDAVLVGSFEFEGTLGGRGYHTFYCSALKTLEKDYKHEIAFAVTTSADDAAIMQVEMPALRLYLWNETHDFPLDAAYSEETVSTWVLQKTQTPSHWLTPSGLKSSNLGKFVTTGPTLVLFTPAHPLLPVQPAFSLLKEISLRYYNCNGNPWINAISDRIETTNRELLSERHKMDASCSRMRQVRIDRTERVKSMTCVVATATASALNNRTECQIQQTISPGIIGPQLEVCARPTKSSRFSYDTSMWLAEKDELGPAALLTNSQLEECKVFETANGGQKIWYPKLLDKSGMTGMACTNNRTLSFVALDSMLNYQLAEGLGIDILNLPRKSAAVIIDAQSERHFVLKDPLTQASLEEMIANHTEGLLERHRRSTLDWDSRSLTKHTYPIVKDSHCSHTENQSCIRELTADDFLTTVMDPTKAVLVFYHTSLCGLCRSVAHIILLVARYFRHFPSLSFVRIDGELNDLPWEFNMDTYPTLLFFPTIEKADSRIFSDNLPFTVQTVMHFVLANLEVEAKVPAMVSLCKSFEKLQTDTEAAICKTKIQVQIQEGLSFSLRRMRVILARTASAPPGSPSAASLYRLKAQTMASLQFLRNAVLAVGSQKRVGSSMEEINELYVRFVHR